MFVVCWSHSPALAALTGCIESPPRHLLPAPVRADNEGVRTFGVEEELLIVNPVSGEPMPLAHAVLAQVEGAAGPRPPFVGDLQHEFKQEQVETTTKPCRSFEDLETGIRHGRRLVDDAARSVGARVAALATPPVPSPTHLVPDSRYRAMVDKFGLTAAEQITCGFHVHVSVSSDAEGVGVLNGIRPWLPVLLALSANSPFWVGTDSGYASYRTQVWSRWPATGPAPHFHSATEYRMLVKALVNTGVLLDESMIYFDARLSRHQPTVEVRIADVCLEPTDAVVIATLVRGLVNQSAADWQQHKRSRPVPTAVLHMGNWMGSLYGVSADLLHPENHLPRPATEVVGALFDHVRGALDGSTERAYVERGLTSILLRGPGERAQRKALHERGFLSDAVAAAFV